MLLYTFFSLAMFEEVRGLSAVKNYIRDNSFVDQVCESSYISFEATFRSPVDCAKFCTKTSGCNSLILDKTNNICYGLTSSFACYGSASPLQGARFYRPKEQVCGVKLVTGSFGVRDYQMTASSEYSENYKPAHARLNHNFYWGPLDADLHPYLQVDFLTVRLVTAIITQGSCCEHHHWIASYWFLYSTDCVIYTAIKDYENGSDKVFEGNSNSNTLMNNTLASPVLGKCVRLKPQSWVIHPCLRLEMMGCVPT